jgi:hypothetical protein
MQFLKISCPSCSQYSACPKKTRLFINYCGSNVKRIEQKINDAAFDCRTRRGLLITHAIISTDPIVADLQGVFEGAAS